MVYMPNGIPEPEYPEALWLSLQAWLLLSTDITLSKWQQMSVTHATIHYNAR